jgi:hypothetical protein
MQIGVYYTLYHRRIGFNTPNILQMMGLIHIYSTEIETFTSRAEALGAAVGLIGIVVGLIHRIVHK